MGIYKSESEKVKPLIYQYLQGKKSVIDIGVGHAEKITQNAVGIDTRKLPNVDLVINPNDIYKLHEFPGYEGGFDLCFSSHLLEHLTNDRAALLSWSKLLSKDGIMILYLPDVNYYKEDNPDHRQYYTLENFFDKLNSQFDFLELISSFRDIRNECWSFCVILKKKYIQSTERYY
jgi:predicted SAM-dependent methyltransferase